MTDNQKVYIRGVEGRGIDVIAALERLGGKTDRVGSLRLYAFGNIPYNVFIIGHDGQIAYTDSKGEAFEIIKDNYREIKLSREWSDGDILIRKGNNDIFCVYQKPVDNGKGFLCHVYVSKDTLFTGVTVPAEAADNYRKATDAEELTFYSLGFVEQRVTTANYLIIRQTWYFITAISNKRLIKHSEGASVRTRPPFSQTLKRKDNEHYHLAHTDFLLLLLRLLRRRIHQRLERQGHAGKIINQIINQNYK